MPGIRKTLAKAIKAQRKPSALLAFESNADDWCCFARNALDIVQDILRLFDTMHQGQYIRIGSEVNRLVLPQTSELVFVQTNYPRTLFSKYKNMRLEIISAHISFDWFSPAESIVAPNPSPSAIHNVHFRRGTKIFSKSPSAATRNENDSRIDCDRPQSEILPESFDRMFVCCT